MIAPPPIPIREHEPMERHSSWRAGGAARYYAEPASPAEAQALAAWARLHRLPLAWVGRGTNLLVRDAGYPGLIASYRAQDWQIAEQGDSALLAVEAGHRRAASPRWAGPGLRGPRASPVRLAGPSSAMLAATAAIRPRCLCAPRS